MNYGFIRVAAAIPDIKVADCSYNISQIIDIAQKADNQQIQAICFPELCITGYTCADLFFQSELLHQAGNALHELQLQTAKLNCVIIVGMPFELKNQLFNVAVVLQRGKILGIVPKTHLPNNNEFYEKRWFTPSASITDQSVNFRNQDIPFGTDLLFTSGAFSFAIELCEDLWVPIPPSSQHAVQGAELIFILS